ncbi:MAG: ABC transporter ATP-binding protein [Geminicoccaceae bacterium]
MAEARNGQRTLEAREISVNFQGLRAVSSVDLDLRPGEILGLIGPNGAGKTTLVNVLTGFQRPTSGRVVLQGEDVTRMDAAARAKRGLVRTFQNVLLFGGLSVVENVEAGAIAMGVDRGTARSRAMQVLDGLGLSARAQERSSSLPFGEERRVGIGRAIAMRPHFLLMDEPAAGLNDAECEDLRSVIADVRDEVGCGILLIEHRVSLVFSLCDRIQVLEQGRTLAVGLPEAVRADPEVRRAYLGEELH